MKKEMNGKSRRKWVVGGAMVFGSIALLSTGFATWVIGALNNTYDGEITVAIDQVKNESITVTGDMTDANIKIADENSTDGLVRVENSDRDLDVTVKLTAVYSIEYGAPGDVAVEFKDKKSNYIPAATIDNCHTDITGHNWATGRTSTDNGYAVFADAITVKDAGTWVEVTGAAAGTKKSERTITYSFAIGGIWKDNSFAKHVNNVYSDRASDADATLYGEIETEMEEEIKAITDYFSSNKLTLHLTVEKA